MCSILFVYFSFSIASENPTIGAIRWDAWYGGNITKEVEKTLSPKKYHYRLPWFAHVNKNNKAIINGNSQNIMDQEIMYAYHASIDYWAFLIYPESSSMSSAIKHYLKSKSRDKINFCIILKNTLNKKLDKKEWNRTLKLLQEPGYQKVLNGRPLVYIFNKNISYKTINKFRKDANKRGLNPYIVYMGWDSVLDFKKYAKLKFDAFSSYARSSNKPKYTQLTKSVEKTWKRALRNKVPIVPLVTTGWDKNPRKDNHVPWEKNKRYFKQKIFPSTATPEEISLHLINAISFVKSNRNLLTKANTIIIYAWNENDEGGWIIPTWNEDGQANTDRIDAVKKAIKQ